MKKEAGYVYILTNPSFKEDWVKIGKSSRPVDVRSKELDNTAVNAVRDLCNTQNLEIGRGREVDSQDHRPADRFADSSESGAFQRTSC